MYSDFNYRPPPPSYQASMQEYRLRLLLLDRGHPNLGTSSGVNNGTPEARNASVNNDRVQQQQLLHQGSALPSTLSPPMVSGETSAVGNISPPPAYRSHLRYFSTTKELTFKPK